MILEVKNSKKKIKKSSRIRWKKKYLDKDKLKYPCKKQIKKMQYEILKKKTLKKNGKNDYEQLQNSSQKHCKLNKHWMCMET